MPWLISDAIYWSDQYIASFYFFCKEIDFSKYYIKSKIYKLYQYLQQIACFSKDFSKYYIKSKIYKLYLCLSGLHLKDIPRQWIKPDGATSMTNYDFYPFINPLHQSSTPSVFWLKPLIHTENNNRLQYGFLLQPNRCSFCLWKVCVSIVTLSHSKKSLFFF